MAESSDLIDFVKKHYTREAVDAQDMLKNGVNEVNENAERILSEGISRMREELKTNVTAMTRKVDSSMEATSSTIENTISEMRSAFDKFSQSLKSDIERTTVENAELIDKRTEKMGYDITSFTREINDNIVEMKNRTSSAETSAKMASRMAAASLGGFVALLIFILIGS